MEAIIYGPGTVLIRIIDSSGRTLIEDQISVSGSESVRAKTEVPLSLETQSGTVAVAPAVVSQSNPNQRVTFDGQDAKEFTRKRCDQIGCSSQIKEDAARGQVHRLSGQGRKGSLPVFVDFSG